MHDRLCRTPLRSPSIWSQYEHLLCSFQAHHQNGAVVVKDNCGQNETHAGVGFQESHKLFPYHSFKDLDDMRIEGDRTIFFV